MKKINDRPSENIIVLSTKISLIALYLLRTVFPLNLHLITPAGFYIESLPGVKFPIHQPPI